jgi:uncharacterized protein YdhG (YjbR/CyaY superfamily)
MTTVQAYIDAAEESRRPTLYALRKLVRETVPDAVESIRHGMPYYNHHGDLCAFAAQKRYYSFYVMSAGEPIAPHRGALGTLDVGKGCIRFTSLDELPGGVLAEILTAAAEANETRAGVTV